MVPMVVRWTAFLLVFASSLNSSLALTEEALLNVTRCPGSEFSSKLCPGESTVIQVQRADYGDYPNHKWCPQCCTMDGDCMTDVRQVDPGYYAEIQHRCNGRAWCDGLQAKVPDGRVGMCARANYVVIFYVCVERDVNVQLTVDVQLTGTKNGLQYISQCVAAEFPSPMCTAPGDVITVKGANYGDYPSHQWCQGCCPTAGDCHTDIQHAAPEYYQEIRRKCNGRQHCEGLTATAPDERVGRCGTANYVTILYSCGPETEETPQFLVTVPPELHKNYLEVTKCPGSDDQFSSILCQNVSTVVQVQRALFGDFPSHKWCPGCCTMEGDCMTDVRRVDPGYYAEIQHRCDGGASCDGLQARVPRDKIGSCGRANYVTVQYACVDRDAYEADAKLQRHLAIESQVERQAVESHSLAHEVGTGIGVAVIVIGSVIAFVLLGILLMKRKGKPWHSKAMMAIYSVRPGRVRCENQYLLPEVETDRV